VPAELAKRKNIQVADIAEEKHIASTKAPASREAA
jgi:hypothetical protein